MKNIIVLLLTLSFYCSFGSLSAFAASETLNERSWVAEFICAPRAGATDPFQRLVVNMDPLYETSAQFILTYENGVTVQFDAGRKIVPPGADAEIKYSYAAFSGA